MADVEKTLDDLQKKLDEEGRESDDLEKGLDQAAKDNTPPKYRPDHAKDGGVI
jgi:hypothetical protein